MKTIVSSANAIETAATAQFEAPASSGNVNKRPVSLNLNTSPAKKQRLVTPTPLMLETPDLQSMKTLGTPDLEKILLSSNLLQTPQPGVVFPSKDEQATSEQESFSKGFEDALQHLHHSKCAQPVPTTANSIPAVEVSSTPAASVSTAAAITSAVTGSMSGGSFTYTNLAESNFPIAIKDEPQNTCVSPPVSPIDMETQEKIKLDRKRLRNRVAASKCRKRKLERISKLEDKVKMLKGENTELGQVMKNLKNHVAQLKQQVIEHVGTGCSIPVNGSVLAQAQ